MTEVMLAVVNMAERLGVKSINTLPGCWEHQIDKHWWIAVNGKRKPQMCSKGVQVPPFSIYIEFNGWPAGICDSHGGVICAGAVGNEKEFIDACNRHGNPGS
jgi:hypothetical protein